MWTELNSTEIVWRSSPPLEEHSEAKTQEDLLDEYLEMVKALKNNAISIKDQLSRDKMVVEELTGAVEANKSVTERENERLKDHLGASSWGTCATIGALITVVVAFMCTYIFMRLFSKPRV